MQIKIKDGIISLRNTIPKGQFDLSIHELKKELNQMGFNPSRDRITTELGALTSEKAIRVRERGGKRSFYLYELVEVLQNSLRTEQS